MSEKKICVATVYDADNCGAFLQAYALKKYLEKMGYYVSHVKYRTRKEMKHAYFDYDNITFFSYLKRHLGYSYKNYLKHKLSLKYFNEIGENQIDKYEMMIVGSDELWNVTNGSIKRNIKLSTYKHNKKIAYAVSCGNSEVEDIMDNEKLYNAIKEFQMILPRDKQTKKVVDKICDVASKQVCDPTLLLTLKDYEQVKNHKKIQEKHMLLYIYGSDRKPQKIILDYCRKNGLKLVSVGIKNSWSDINIACEPLEILQYVNEADVFVTSTFHGTISAILNKKNFACIDLGNRKLNDLLEKLNLTERIVDLENNNLNEILSTNIDYKKVYKELEKYQKETIEILEEIL